MRRITLALTISGIFLTTAFAQEGAASPSGAWNIKILDYTWNVTLKRTPAQDSDGLRAYCGEGIRDTPDGNGKQVKARICAVVAKGEFMLDHESIIQCAGRWKAGGPVQGTCSLAGGSVKGQLTAVRQTSGQGRK